MPIIDLSGAVNDISLRRMLRAAPDRFYARYYIGLSLMWLGRMAEALDLFERTCEQHSPDVAALRADLLYAPPL